MVQGQKADEVREDLDEEVCPNIVVILWCSIPKVDKLFLEWLWWRCVRINSLRLLVEGEKHTHNGKSTKVRRSATEGSMEDVCPDRHSCLAWVIQLPTGDRFLLKWPWQRYIRMNSLGLLVENKNTRNGTAEETRRGARQKFCPDRHCRFT